MFKILTAGRAKDYGQHVDAIYRVPVNDLSTLYSQSQIFNEVFEPVDLTPVDFLRLMNLAERYEIGEGEHLFDEGKVQEEVFLIAEGNVEVRVLIRATWKTLVVPPIAMSPRTSSMALLAAPAG